MATDGKYCSLVNAKLYLVGSRTDPGNPTVFNGQVSGTPDDGLLSDCIFEAETAFEQGCGTGFDQQTYAYQQPIQNFVDQFGWLHLFARERGPVTAVSAISYMDLFAGSTQWVAMTWDVTGTPPNGIILPPSASIDNHPWPESWRVRIKPLNPSFLSRSTGQILIAWSYTGGFASVPQSLLTLIMRMTVYTYKLREAPLGRVNNRSKGNAMVPEDFPADIQKQIRSWSPVYG